MCDIGLVWFNHTRNDTKLSETDVMFGNLSTDSHVLERNAVSLIFEKNPWFQSVVSELVCSILIIKNNIMFSVCRW